MREKKYLLVQKARRSHGGKVVRLHKLLFLGVSMVLFQGCYTQMVVERKVVVVQEKQDADTVVIVEEDHSLVYEYRYWFNNHRYYDFNRYAMYPAYNNVGLFIDISWYDPFYDPWYAYGPYPIYNPWTPYLPYNGYGYWAGGYSYPYYNSRYYHSGWWAWYGENGYSEPQPPKKPRDWKRREAENLVGGIQRGNTSNSSDILFTGTSATGAATRNERSTLARKPVEGTRITKIEKNRESRRFEIKRTTKKRSSNGEVSRKQSTRDTAKSKSVSRSSSNRQEKSVRSATRRETQKSTSPKAKATSSRMSRKSNRR